MAKTNSNSLDFKKNIHNGLTFFQQKINYINTQRLGLNRNKNIAKYVTKLQGKPANLASFDAPLGIMSFSLYYARLVVNIGLLVELIVSNEESKNKKNKKFYKLSLSLLNDLLWSTNNLVQFFWLTSRCSSAAGLRGLQLEVLGQFLDLVIMLINYQQVVRDYENKWAKASADKRAFLALEWQYRQMNYIRNIIHMSSVIVVMGGLLFQLHPCPYPL